MFPTINVHAPPNKCTTGVVERTSDNVICVETLGPLALAFGKLEKVLTYLPNSGCQDADYHTPDADDTECARVQTEVEVESRPL